jgi:hypothetical protein
MSLALLGFVPTLRRETSSQGPSFSWPWGGLYEGYLDDTFGKCFRPLLIERIAFGSQHSGSYEFDAGQRPAKSLRSWTPFRLQKIGYTEVLYTQKALVALSNGRTKTGLSIWAIIGSSSLRDQLPISGATCWKSFGTFRNPGHERFDSRRIQFNPGVTAWLFYHSVRLIG